MAEQTNQKKEDAEIGALWTRESNTDGKKFWSGKITIGGKKESIVVFTNTFKEKGDNKPSLKIYKDRPNPNAKPKEEENEFPD